MKHNIVLIGMFGTQIAMHVIPLFIIGWSIKQNFIHSFIGPGPKKHPTNNFTGSNWAGKVRGCSDNYFGEMDFYEAVPIIMLDFYEAVPIGEIDCYEAVPINLLFINYFMSLAK